MTEEKKSEETAQNPSAEDGATANTCPCSQHCCRDIADPENPDAPEVPEAGDSCTGACNPLAAVNPGPAAPEDLVPVHAGEPAVQTEPALEPAASDFENSSVPPGLETQAPGAQPAAAATETETALEPGTVVAIVCYGKSFERAFFTARMTDLAPGEIVVVRTRRGTEHGRVVEILDSRPQAPVEGSVARRPNTNDLAAIKRMESDEFEAEFVFCKAKISEQNLPMKLVDVERILGGEKLVFCFTANGRVDFRGLVKTLAQEYRMRIELKQIGVRDEAKVLGTISHCGRELCCRSFMKAIEQVTMKMAKVQKSTLDPTKISGRCGRLMCCLRFEDDIYNDLKKELPPRGSKVWTARGQVEVFDHQILSQRLLVRTAQGERLNIPLSDVLDGPPPPPPPPPPPSAATAPPPDRPLLQRRPEKPRMAPGDRTESQQELPRDAANRERPLQNQRGDQPPRPDRGRDGQSRQRPPERGRQRLETGQDRKQPAAVQGGEPNRPPAARNAPDRPQAEDLRAAGAPEPGKTTPGPDQPAPHGPASPDQRQDNEDRRPAQRKSRFHRRRRPRGQGPSSPDSAPEQNRGGSGQDPPPPPPVS